MRGALITLGLTASLFAQTPQFEVASVRPTSSPGFLVQIGLQPGGRFIASNVSLRMLLRTAYGVEDYQLIGGPDWMNTSRFDIAATAGREVTRNEALVMLQQLLSERFRVRAHRETRDLPVFELIIARPDGRLGDGLRRSGETCAALKLPVGAPPPPPPPPGANVTTIGAGTPLACPSMFSPGLVSARAITMGQLAVRLSPFAGRPVIDRTKLAGSFDADLLYWHDSGFVAAPPPGAPPGINPADVPALPTAIQEQLGLRLVPARGPVDVLVVDGAELPTEN